MINLELDKCDVVGNLIFYMFLEVEKMGICIYDLVEICDFYVVLGFVVVIVFIIIGFYKMLLVKVEEGVCILFKEFFGCLI